MGGEEIGEFSLLWISKIHLNQLKYRLRVQGSGPQQQIPPKNPQGTPSSQMSSADHKIPTFLFNPQFYTSQSEVWKCEITLLSFLIPSSTLLRYVEVWNSLTKSGSCHPFPLIMKPLSFFTQFHTSRRCGSVEKTDKVRIMSHFSRSHEPLVVLYLVLHFSEVWKCGKV